MAGNAELQAKLDALSAALSEALTDIDHEIAQLAASGVSTAQLSALQGSVDALHAASVRLKADDEPATP